MDPLTHTFLGAVLADTGLRRRTALAGATLIIGANLPDVDVLAYVHGPDAALGFRRGWTHGVLALVVLPVLLTLAMLAVDRWRRRRGGPGPPADPRQLFLLSAIGVASHPLLDWLNTYGVRVLMPFDGRWLYGDALYIVDPWVWLAFGGTLFLLHSGSRRARLAWLALAALTTALVFAAAGPHGWARWVWSAGIVAFLILRRRLGSEAPAHQRRHIARLALAGAALYTAGMVALTPWAEGRTLAQLRSDGVEPEAPLMVGPDRIDPLRRLVVVPVDGAYRFGSYHPLRHPRLELGAPHPILTSSGLTTPEARRAVDAAEAAPCVRGMVGWLRYPFYEVDGTEDGVVVHLLDARYTRGRTRGFGGAVVPLSSDLEPRCEVEDASP